MVRALEAVEHVVQDQAETTDPYNSLQEADLLVLDEVHFCRKQVKVGYAGHEEDGAHDPLVFEEHEVGFSLDHFDIQQVIVGVVCFHIGEVYDDHAEVRLSFLVHGHEVSPANIDGAIVPVLVEFLVLVELQLRVGPQLSQGRLGHDLFEVLVVIAKVFGFAAREFGHVV
jgi:hypothetical protein